jgi:hypothetical protein
MRWSCFLPFLFWLFGVLLNQLSHYVGVMLSWGRGIVKRYDLMRLNPVFTHSVLGSILVQMV